MLKDISFSALSDKWRLASSLPVVATTRFSWETPCARPETLLIYTRTAVAQGEERKEPAYEYRSDAHRRSSATMSLPAWSTQHAATDDGRDRKTLTSSSVTVVSYSADMSFTSFMSEATVSEFFS